jgi:hypothetical protein
MSSDDDSSASDNDRSRQPPPPPPFSGKSKSKKKKKLPPQETIDKIWSRFSASKFSKATKILPFTNTSDPSKVPTTNPSPDNLLVSEDFERAVQECRTKVRKLIKECKRVNMRYRDPTFDIDWDLKWEKGYCLNGLAESKFEINGRAFANPNSTVPKAVKRVHEIYDKPTFLKDKVSPADVKQGCLGDCWLMASLTALANLEVGIHRICVEYDTSGTFLSFEGQVLIVLRNWNLWICISQRSVKFEGQSFVDMTSTHTQVCVESGPFKNFRKHHVQTEADSQNNYICFIFS